MEDRTCRACGETKPLESGFYKRAKGVAWNLDCLNCNAGLGQFSDSLGLLEAAAEYLRKNG